MPCLLQRSMWWTVLLSIVTVDPSLTIAGCYLWLPGRVGMVLCSATFCILEWYLWCSSLRWWTAWRQGPHLMWLWISPLVTGPVLNICQMNDWILKCYSKGKGGWVMTLNGISLTEPEGWVELGEILDLNQELPGAYSKFIGKNYILIVTKF